MKKFLAGLAATAAAATGALALSATPAAAADATIMLLHGIPGADVDVAVAGAVVIPNFKPGQMQDLSSFAGKTLTNLEVRAAGTTTVVIGPVASFPVPAEGNYTVVAHLDATGKPTLTPFKNDTSAVGAGQGRLTVRHTAAAPAVDIVLGAARPFTNLVNGKEGSAALPAGPIAGAKVAPTGAAPIADVPTVDLKAGTNLIVYAVGSLSANTFTYYTQSITGLGGAPTRVDTGNSPVSSSSVNLAATLALIGGVVLVGSVGALGLRRVRSY
jgi:hypothetical protein